MVWPWKPTEGRPKNKEFIIDISKPPIFPPCRTIKCGIFGEYETKESKQRTEAWKRYIKKYEEELDKGDKTMSVPGYGKPNSDGGPAGKGPNSGPSDWAKKPQKGSG